MPVEEDARALEAMAALLPHSDPHRRELEGDAYLLWKELDPRRAKALAKTWDPEKTPHLDRLLPKLYRRDPKLARALIPWYQANEYCGVWLKLLLDNWQEGDGALAAVPITGCNTLRITLRAAREIASRLHQFSPEDRVPLIFPLLAQAATFELRKDAPMLVHIMAHAGELAQGERFQEKAFWIAYSADTGNWRKELRKAARAGNLTDSLVGQLRLIHLARAFHGHYLISKPAKVTPRFVARWRRAKWLAARLDEMPNTEATRRLRENYKNLQARTARHLREGADDYLTRQRSIKSGCL
jgi:hypothetical protein